MKPEGISMRCQVLGYGGTVAGFAAALGAVRIPERIKETVEFHIRTSYDYFLT